MSSTTTATAPEPDHSLVRAWRDTMHGRRVEQLQPMMPTVPLEVLIHIVAHQTWNPLGYEVMCSRELAKRISGLLGGMR